LSSQRTTREKLHNLITEQPNPASAALDRKSALGIARIIHREDAKVAKAVHQALPNIARAIDLIANAFRAGGRLIYVGTGTSRMSAHLQHRPAPGAIHHRRRQTGLRRSRGIQ
jgi:N-acetylmuramic acid 6-phosphate etherase